MLSVFPVLFPFLTGIVLVLMQRREPALRRTFSLGSLAVQILLAVSLCRLVFLEGTFVSPLGSWTDPVGIVLVADKTASLLVLLGPIIAFTAVLGSMAEGRPGTASPFRQPLVHFLLTGIQLGFLTGDLFNLFVAFEVMLLSSYALMTLEAEKGKVKHAFPYVLLNVLASALFLAGCGMTYALFGSLNFAHIAERAAAMTATPGGSGKVGLLTALLAFVFSIKAGMFPLYYWLPKSYPTLPAAIASLYAAMMAKVGLYLLLRLLGTLMPPTQEVLYALFVALGGATMLFGVLGAVSRNGVREILAFHGLSQYGFMLIGIGFFTPFGFAASLFFMIHHTVVKAGLFLTAAGIRKSCGSDHLKKTGGIWEHQPLFGLAFLLLALSLAGLPPFSGFWAKLWILMEGFQQGYYLLIAASLVASLLTLTSMLKIWDGAFWRASPEASAGASEWRHPASLRAATGLLLALSLALVLFVRPVWEASSAAAAELFHPTAYVESVKAALSER